MCYLQSSMEVTVSHRKFEMDITYQNNNEAIRLESLGCLILLSAWEGRMLAQI